MSNSLRDQLVKAGLATNAQAKKAEKQQRAEEVAQRHGGGKKKSQKSAHKSKDTAQDKAKRLQREKAAKDKEKAKARNDKYAQRALRAEIKQLVIANDQRKKIPENQQDSAVAYNFVHGKKIKRIYVSADEREKLSSGKLIVINNDGLYHFVLPAIADKIRQRDPGRIIVAHDQAKSEAQTGGKPINAEDEAYYAQFEVPDDLDW